MQAKTAYGEKSGKRRTAFGLGRVRSEVGFRDIVAVLLDRATMVCLPHPLTDAP
jgi:hypothetical protein